MSVRKAYILVLILSLLVVDESSSPFLLRPASASILSSSLKIFKTLNFRNISKALKILKSFLHSNGGRIRKGDIVDGISNIKDYLDLFGYFSSTLNLNFTDEFSGDLESAIRYFQKTFHLNVTGQPDNATLSLITLPRCGLPDVINDSSTVLENRRTTSFTKWWPAGKTELTYAFSPENETGSQLKDTFVGAFRRWSAVTGLNFTETTSFNEADIQVIFSSFYRNLGVVGGAWLDNTTMRWDVVLDSDEKWVLPSEHMTESDELDLETVVMHQMGHVLGLSHSAIEESVMYPFIVPSNKRKVNFSEDDLKKIRQLYGTKSNSSDLSQVKSPPSGAAEVAGVGPRCGQVPTLWLGISFLFWF